MTIKRELHLTKKSFQSCIFWASFYTVLWKVLDFQVNALSLSEMERMNKVVEPDSLSKFQSGLQVFVLHIRALLKYYSQKGTVTFLNIRNHFFRSNFSANKFQVLISQCHVLAHHSQLCSSLPKSELLSTSHQQLHSHTVKATKSSQVIMVTLLLTNSHWEGCALDLSLCFTRETGERIKHMQRRWLVHFIDFGSIQKRSVGFNGSVQ